MAKSFDNPKARRLFGVFLALSFVTTQALTAAHSHEDDHDHEHEHAAPVCAVCFMPASSDNDALPAIDIDVSSPAFSAVDFLTTLAYAPRRSGDRIVSARAPPHG